MRLALNDRCIVECGNCNYCNEDFKASVSGKNFQITNGSQLSDHVIMSVLDGPNAGAERNCPTWNIRENLTQKTRVEDDQWHKQQDEISDWAVSAGVAATNAGYGLVCAECHAGVAETHAKNCEYDGFFGPLQPPTAAQRAMDLL